MSKSEKNIDTERVSERCLCHQGVLGAPDKESPKMAPAVNGVQAPVTGVGWSRLWAVDIHCGWGILGVCYGYIMV